MSRKNLAKALQLTYYSAQWMFNANFVKGKEKLENSFLAICFIGLMQSFVINLTMLFETGGEKVCFDHYLSLLDEKNPKEKDFKEAVEKLLEENKKKIGKLHSIRGNDLAHRNAKVSEDVLNGKIPSIPRPTFIELAELLGIAERIISGIEVTEFKGHTKKQRQRLEEQTLADWEKILQGAGPNHQ